MSGADPDFFTRTSFYGESFEHFVILEISRLNHYLEKDYRMSYFQTYDGAEVDLVLSKTRRDPILVEIKSTDRVDEDETTKIARYGKELKAGKIFYLSRDPIAKKVDTVSCLPWRQGIGELGLIPS